MVRLMPRGLAMGVAVLTSEVLYARNRRVPSFGGHDPSGSFGDPENPTLRVVILGDSVVTAPGLDSPDASWVRIVARHLARRFRVDLVSLAEGGARSADVLERQLPAALVARWDLAIVSVGSNDIVHLVPVWQFERRLDEIIGRLRAVTDEVVLFGVGDLGSIPRLVFPLSKVASGAGHVADRVQRRVAARHGVAKVDQWALTTEAFNAGRHMFSPDLFHPSAIGHRVWAEALLPTIDQAVARRSPGTAEARTASRTRPTPTPQPLTPADPSPGDPASGQTRRYDARPHL